MNAQLANTVSPVATIFSQIMNEAAKAEGRQVALVIAMFESEVTFANSVLENIFRKKGADRSEIREKLLRDVSDDYKNAVDMVASLKEKKKTSKSQSEKEAFQVEALNRKIRAANAMFDRAAITVYGLRTSNTKKIKTGIGGNATVKVFRPDEEDDTTLVSTNHSANELMRQGQKAVDTLLGKAASNATTSNPQTASDTRAGQAEAVAKYVATADKPLVDIEGKEGEAYSELFKTMFKNMFAVKEGDKTVVVAVSIVDFIRDELNLEIEGTVAPKRNNGNKPKQEKAA